MSHDFTPTQGGLLPVEVALSLLQDRVTPINGTETVSLDTALGRVLAVDVTAEVNVPPHANSAMDGWGFAHGTQPDDGPYPIVGTVAAGHPFAGTVPAGSAVRILTGAPVPDGVDSVAMQEDCTAQDGMVRIPNRVKAGANVRPLGDDVRAGTVVLRAGQRLRPQDLGIAAAVGETHLTVMRALRVAVFSTGDEIRAPGHPLPPGCIYDTNRTTAMGLLRALGCAVTDLGILPDRQAVIADALAAAAQTHDLIVTSGGVSVGDEDHVRAAVQQHGTLHFWKMAIKPGKPIAMGSIGDTAFIGLPGNPVAVMVSFMLVARPMILRLMGAAPTPTPSVPVRAGFSLRRKAGRREWLRARLEVVEGVLTAQTYHSDGSGVLSSMVWSDGLVQVHEDLDSVQPGDILPYISYAEVLR